MNKIKKIICSLCLKKLKRGDKYWNMGCGWILCDKCHTYCHGDNNE